MRAVIIRPGIQGFGGYTSIVLEDIFSINSDNLEERIYIEFDGCLSFQRRQVIIRELKSHFGGLRELTIDSDTQEDADGCYNMEISIPVGPETQLLITMEKYD